MKKVFKVIGIILLVFVVLIALLFIKGAMTPFVPKDYTETTGVVENIESKYLKMGDHDVSYFEKEVDEAYKKYEIYYPSEMEEENKEYPVVVFINGTGVVGSKYKALFEHLASWGFIVIGNEEQESWNGNASEKSLVFLLQENENPVSMFYKKIDLNNIGVSGHSQGGAGVFNTITKHEHSDLYKTAVALSPVNEEQAIALKWYYDLTKINIPLLMIAGTKGDFETKTVIPLDKMIAMYEKINAPKIMMRRVDANHGQMLYFADGYVTAWFMWQLQNDENASLAFIGSNPEVLNNELYQDQKIDLQ